MIYFARATATVAVKIGVAALPERRIKDLQQANHCELEIIRTIEGGKKIERWLHAHFKSQAIRGEWFTYCEEMLTVTPPLLEDVPSVRREVVHLRLRAELRERLKETAAKDHRTLTGQLEYYLRKVLPPPPNVVG